MQDISGRINVSAEKFLHNLEAGEHGCIFYSSREEMQRIHFAFVKSGLESNWGVVYATATEPVENVRKSMQRYGIDAMQYEKNEEGDGSLLIVRGEDLYINDENPDINHWMNIAKSISEMFASKGKKGVRVAADLSSHFLARGLIHQWHKLEYALEKKISLPISILCAYNSHYPDLLESDVLRHYAKLYNENKDLVDAHAFAIYASKYSSVVFRI
jgi:hypothetical protein